MPSEIEERINIFLAAYNGAFKNSEIYGDIFTEAVDIIKHQAEENKDLIEALEGIRNIVLSVESGVLAYTKEKLITSLLHKTQAALTKARRVNLQT